MKKFIQRISITLLLVLVSAWAILFFLPLPPLLSDISFSRAVFDKNQKLLRLTLSQDEKYRLYTPLKTIPKQLVEGTLLQEDQYFHWHLGVNPVAMTKALWQTYLLKSRRIGASTITMQLARIRYSIHSKKPAGKILQIVRALQLEMHYSKNQILEAYFNLAPYGNNIEGVGAASLIYFGKPVAQLSLPEALTLSVIPQNPTQRVPSQKNLKTIRNKLFARWLVKHPDDRNQQAMIDLPLQMQRVHGLPFIAPQFVDMVLNSAPSHQQNITTTLDSHLQTIIEQVSRQYLARKNNIGVHNAAILLVDTRDMGVKALVGSADFFNKAIGGQINGTEMKRSPGSTLKPFIYGLAIDQGLIHPNTVLKDVPHSFGSYNPENFDNDFMGPIKAREALTLSRNIPAIYLADLLNKPNLYTFLEKAEVSHLKPASYYGLALVLGGAELSMQELTGLYAMLVNDGVWHPLRLRQEEVQSPGKRLLSPEASYLILDMLKSTPRFEPSYLVTSRSIPIAWKTGTSSGYRDAWTFSAFGPYVLAVWIGNFDNTSNPAFVGKTIAAPLMFEIVDAINTQTGPLPSISKNLNAMNLKQVSVCKASGMLPTRYCESTELTWFIPGKSPIKTDTIYREVPINGKTGLRTCQLDQDTRFQIYEFWPSDLLKIFKTAGIDRRSPPPYDASCLNAKSTAGIEPQITSPQTELSYVFRARASQKNIIPFTAVADADVVTLYWFLNATYLGKTKRDQPLLWSAKPGHFVARVADDHGRSDARDITIRVDS
ncbi:MAG: penicillin-binding protein 1C [Gammaproteobacteria bacterium]|nr:penicillin-binding protein 1C [Gammaproteobacteria bacterium]